MSQYPSTYEESQGSGSGSGPGLGLPIAALVCAVLGMCLPGVGLIALILGIVAIMRGSKAGTAFGLALAAIIVGALSLVSSLLIMGIMLPALGKARNVARQMKSAEQLRQIDTALIRYAGENKGWMPEAGADWQARLQQYGVTTSLLVSPRAEDQTATDSYIYIPGFRIDTIKDPNQAIVAYENPKYASRGMASIAFADGHVEAVPVKDLEQALSRSPKPGP